MDRPRRGISAEIVGVSLTLGCVVTALVTVIAVYRRPSTSAPPPAPILVAVATEEVKPAEPKPAPKPKPTPPPPPPRVAETPPEDPTKPIVAKLTQAEIDEREQATKNNREAAVLLLAVDSARNQAEKWNRNLTIAKGQVSNKTDEAKRLESTAELAQMERDALAKRRDLLKKSIARDQARPSYAVLPHKGQNGTWQRPIVLECKDNSIALRPKGPTFDIFDLDTTYSGRNSSFASLIAREAVRIQRQTTPDGEDVTPYIFFIIRPTGVRAYYEARGRLERLGIAFGYELADGDWEIDVPDLDQPAVWDGSPPAHTAEDLAIGGGSGHGSGTGDGGKGTGAGNGGRASREEIDNAFRWPKEPGGVTGRGGAMAGSLGTVNDFAGTGTGNGNGNGTGLGSGKEKGTGAGTEPGNGSGPGDGGRERLTLQQAVEEARARRLGGNGRGNRADGRGTNGDTSDLEAMSAAERYQKAWDRALKMNDPDRPVGLGGGPVESDLLKGMGNSRGPGQLASGSPGAPNSSGGLAPGTLPPGGLPPLPAGLSPNDLPSGVSLSDLTDASGQPIAGGNLPGNLDGVKGLAGLGRSAGTGMGRGSPGVGAGAGTTAGTGNAPGGSGGSGGSGGGEVGGGADPGTGGGTAGGTGAESGGSSGGSGGAQGGQSASGAGAAGAGAGEAGAEGIPGDEGGGEGGLSGLRNSVRPIELVVSCSKKGVTVTPGNYRVTSTSLKEKDMLLVSQLRLIVRQKQRDEPGKFVAPSVRYVIEPGGQETYAMAKTQLMFSGLNWPTTLQVSGGEPLQLFSTDPWK